MLLQSAYIAKLLRRGLLAAVLALCTVMSFPTSAQQRPAQGTRPAQTGQQQANANQAKEADAAKQASDPDQDPKKKPQIWARLRINPNNDHLWAAYFEKDLFDMTKEETAQMNQLKAKLNVALKAKAEAAEAERFRHQKDYINRRYGNITTDVYSELVQNISRNFPMIEQYFDEQFAKYGHQYVYYHVKHPDKQYNKTTWVDEHEAELRKMREEE